MIDLSPPPIPAFPIHWENHHQGMSLRDYFAAKAMQALLTNETLYLSTVSIAEKTSMSVEAALTQMAYEMADAMLKAREQ